MQHGRSICGWMLKDRTMPLVSAPTPTPTRPVALVLAGGVALGAYEAGAYAALHESGADRLPFWIAASSIGAVNAAIIAGNAPECRVEALRGFWESIATHPLPFGSFLLGRPLAGPRRAAYNQAGVVEALLYGRPGLYRPRLAPGPRAGASDVSALYDLDPLRESLARFVDFNRLNGGSVRVSFATTDIVTGERIVFDTAKERVRPEHILASCAMLPVFAPVEVGGRLLGDGCLSSNTPLDLVLDDASSADFTCFVVDLFAREGSRPRGLAASASRAGDLAFANQTRSILQGRQREYRLSELIGRLAERLPPSLRDHPEIAPVLAEGRTGGAELLYLSYRAAPDEAGLLKVFDFSCGTLGDRWQAGAEGMLTALEKLGGESGGGLGLKVQEIAAAMRSPGSIPAEAPEARFAPTA